MFFFIFFLLINQIILLRIEKTLFSPGGTFTIFWLAASIFYSSGFIYFFEPVNELIITLFLTFSSFYIGYYFFLVRYAENIRKNNITLSTIKTSFKSLNLVILFLFSLLTLRTFTVFIDLIAEFGSIQNIFASGDLIYTKLRTDELNVGIGTVINVDMLSCFFVGFRYLLTRKISQIIILNL